MRRPFIAGNWKMHHTMEESRQMLQAFLPQVNGNSNCDVAIFPNSLSIPALLELTKNSSVKIGTQNIHAEAKGAFTGETSIPMARAAGCTISLVGHSERRSLFHESDADVNAKTRALFQADMQVILCIGESLEQREANETLDVVRGQLDRGLLDVLESQLTALTVAYEPVWAIGTGKTASPEQAQEVHRSIRQWFVDCYGKDHAEKIRIQYGGSVKAENIAELMTMPDIDGALVGGASLNADSFAAIVQYKQA